MSPASRIEIPFSKKSHIFSIFGCLFFLSFGYLLVSLANGVNVDPQPQLIAKLAGWGFIGFFGLMMILNLRKLFGERIGLIIDERGITDQVRNLGLIEWQDIESIENFRITINFFPIKYLLLKVRDPQKYIERATGTTMRAMLKTDHLSFGTPLYLTSMKLKCSFSQLEEWTREAWKQNHNRSRPHSS